MVSVRVTARVRLLLPALLGLLGPELELGLKQPAAGGGLMLWLLAERVAAGQQCGVDMSLPHAALWLLLS